MTIKRKSLRERAQHVHPGGPTGCPAGCHTDTLATRDGCVAYPHHLRECPHSDDFPGPGAGQAAQRSQRAEHYWKDETMTDTMTHTVGDCGHIIPDPPDGIVLIRVCGSRSSTGWGWYGVCRDCAAQHYSGADSIEGDWVSALSYAKMNNWSDTSVETLEKFGRVADRIAREAGIDPSPAFD